MPRVIGVPAVGVREGSPLLEPALSTTENPQRSRLSLVLMLGASAVLASGCIVVPAGPRHGGRRRDDDDDDGGEFVAVAPPQPQVDVVIAAPGPGYFWISGYWGWIGRRHVWIGGRWEVYRPGWRWSPYVWQPHKHGWRPRPGRWDRN